MRLTRRAARDLGQKRAGKVCVSRYICEFPRDVINQTRRAAFPAHSAEVYAKAREVLSHSHRLTRRAARDLGQKRAGKVCVSRYICEFPRDVINQTRRAAFPAHSAEVYAKAREVLSHSHRLTRRAARDLGQERAGKVSMCFTVYI